MNQHMPPEPVALFDIGAQRRRLGKSIDEAVGRVLAHCQFVSGPEVAALEQALAESGEPTLIIDFDMRRGCLHSRLRTNREPGLPDYCARDLMLDHVVQSTRYPNLWIIGSGRPPANPPALIGSRAAERLLEECRKRFTWIVLDAPPIKDIEGTLLDAELMLEARVTRLVHLFAGYRLMPLVFPDAAAMADSICFAISANVVTV